MELTPAVVLMKVCIRHLVCMCDKDVSVAIAAYIHLKLLPEMRKIRKWC